MAAEYRLCRPQGHRSPLPSVSHPPPLSPRPPRPLRFRLLLSNMREVRASRNLTVVDRSAPQRLTPERSATFDCGRKAALGPHAFRSTTNGRCVKPWLLKVLLGPLWCRWLRAALLTEVWHDYRN